MFFIQFGRKNEDQALMEEIESLKTEIRSINDPLNFQAQNPEHPSSNPNRWLLDAFNSMPTSAAVRVDPNTATAHSAVYRSVHLIASTLAAFPYSVIKTDKKGGKNIAYDHPIHKLLQSPSAVHNRYIWREGMMQYCLLWGNGYSEIIRDDYFIPISFKLHQSKHIRPFLGIRMDGAEGLFYELTISDPKSGGSKKRIIPSMDMIHIPCLSFDGIAGKSPIEVARENIGLALAAEKFGGDFYKNNAAFSGVYESPGTLSDEAYHRVRESLHDKSQYGEKVKPLLLEDGMTFKPLSMPLSDAQFLDSRKFQIVEIARMYGVPPHKLGDLDRATNNNIEQQALEFITDTMWSWCEKWEAEIDRKLFTEKEIRSGNIYSHFDFAGLLRGDSKQRSDYHRTMFSIGCESQDDIRSAEGLNPLPDGQGNKYFVPLNMVDSNAPEPDPNASIVPGAPGVNGKDKLQLSKIGKNGN